MKLRRIALALPILLAACQAAPPQPWLADLGNGSYRNPILHADYSDPDVIRVGDSYYMTSSSFSNVPGLPLLTSKDLVNWTLVGHALPQLVPAAAFAAPQPGKGVWAPCLRFHDGKFWIFYPDPDFGIYVITAARFEGPWSAPHLLLAGRGMIDPTPLWDDDGKAWLLHAWAKSRAGFNNVLTLRPMSPDARRITGEGKVLIDGNRLPGYTTLEGPKFYKRDGYYYVFAPAGGVEAGWQSVFRSRRIDGPYEDRIVLEQGGSSVNGPHQGAWVAAADGSDWFVHFQDKRAYGRVVHLQPMGWNAGWPLIGAQSAKPGVGEPVSVHRKPVGAGLVAAPPASDEFSAPTLGLQWQWSANWQASWYSLDARPGYLRMLAQAPAPAGLRATASVLGQKLPAPAFQVDTLLALHAQGDGDSAGLLLNGLSYAWLGVRRTGGATRLVFARCDTPAAQCKETVELLAPVGDTPLALRMQMGEGGIARFSYSTDRVNFKPAGEPFKAGMGRWVGAQVGLFAYGQPGAFADVDYLRVTPP
ncbi:MAG: glycoside hydrolase 43 family protein [Pseudomonadota bacterium]